MPTEFCYLRFLHLSHIYISSLITRIGRKEPNVIIVITNRTNNNSLEIFIINNYYRKLLTIRTEQNGINFYTRTR